MGSRTSRPAIATPFRARVPAGYAVGLAAVLLLAGFAGSPSSERPEAAGPRAIASGNTSAVANFSAVINRLVELVGAAGSGLLALVWARVALSWFSHDVTKKVQAKERARDAVIGTLLFVAALTGVIWGLAHWVLTGT